MRTLTRIKEAGKLAGDDEDESPRRFSFSWVGSQETAAMGHMYASKGPTAIAFMFLVCLAFAGDVSSEGAMLPSLIPPNGIGNPFHIHQGNFVSPPEGSAPPPPPPPVRTRTDASGPGTVRAVIDLRGEEIRMGSIYYAVRLEQFKLGMALSTSASGRLSLPPTNVTVHAVDAILTRRLGSRKLHSPISVLPEHGVGAPGTGTRVVAEVHTTVPTTVAVLIKDAFVSGNVTSALQGAGLSNVTAVGLRSLKVGDVSFIGAPTNAAMITSNGSIQLYSPEATALVEESPSETTEPSPRGSVDIADEDIAVAASIGGALVLFLVAVYFVCINRKTKSELSEADGHRLGHNADRVDVAARL